MNKLILITLGVLLVVGVSYQAKRSFDAHQKEPFSFSKLDENSGGFDDKQAPGVNGVNGQTLGQNGVNGVNGQGTAGTNPTNGAGTNGTAGVNGVGGVNGKGIGASGLPGTGDVAKTEPKKPDDNCFAFEYRHKKEARDQDIENFLDYTNAFPIPANYNPKSLCVKVNQKAVNFQVAKFKSNPEIRVGSMVGPESVIRVSYCIGKINPCHEKCDQPKKRFMDDLMSDATDEDSFSDSWGKGEDEAHKKELKAKAKELRTIASENDHLNEGSVQRDWEELQKQNWVCK